MIDNNKHTADIFSSLFQMSTTDNTSAEKRSRSLSPGEAPIQPSEAVRALRTFIREKDNEVQQLERKLKAAEKHAAEFVSKFESADEARRRLEKYLADSKRDVSNLQKNVDDLERQNRRLNDKLRALESEKAASEKARLYLEEELQRLQQ